MGRYLSDSAVSSKNKNLCKYNEGERVVCIDNFGVEDCLVLNQVYVVSYGKTARSDEDYINGYYENRFISIKEYRKRKLEKIKNRW